MPIVNDYKLTHIMMMEHYETLVNRQTKNDKSYDTSRIYNSFLLGSTVVVQ